jgi:3-oxoacyl-[acyl-carrier-protein] synthase-1
VVLEELNHALARGAKIYGEVTGYGATSDGYDMVAPSGEGGERAMRLALSTLPEGPQDRLYQLARHLDACRRCDRDGGDPPRLWPGTTPPIASTKSLTGHSLGATGVHEAIYSLIMMNKDFIAASANITDARPGTRPGRDRDDDARQA